MLAYNSRLLEPPVSLDSPIPRSCLIKIPRQQRSIAMVQTILDAAIIVLQRDGMAAFNTNHVATVAGVSPGSIYQYFANKEMIVAAIVERGVLDVEETIRAQVASAGTIDPLVFIGQLCRLLLAGLEPYRDLLAEILSGTPILSGTGVAAIMESRLSAALTDFLTVNIERYSLRGGRPAVYSVVNGAIYVSLKWLSERPLLITRDDLVDVFIMQLQAMLEVREPMP